MKKAEVDCCANSDETNILGGDNAVCHVGQAFQPDSDVRVDQYRGYKALKEGVEYF